MTTRITSTAFTIVEGRNTMSHDSSNTVHECLLRDCVWGSGVGPMARRGVATGPMTLRGGHALDTSNANADDERLQHRCA